MLLIGSRAARFWCPSFRPCTGKDWDFIGTVEEVFDWVAERKDLIASSRFNSEKTKLLVALKKGDKFEFEFANPGTSSALLLEDVSKFGIGKYPTSRLNVCPKTFHVADLTTLFLIKASHVRHPIRWEKTISDYHFLKSKLDRMPTGRETSFYELRKAEVDGRMGVCRVSLGVTNEDFFQKSERAVCRFYEHDDLHRATCYGPVPRFQLLKKDVSKAALDRQMFFRQSYEDQLRTVREECYAIALERKIIPAIEGNKPYSELAAFNYALQRICTTLTTGWFRDFAIGNHPQIKLFDRKYVSLFLLAVQHGIIRRKVSNVA